MSRRGYKYVYSYVSVLYREIFAHLCTDIYGYKAYKGLKGYEYVHHHTQGSMT